MDGVHDLSVAAGGFDSGGAAAAMRQEEVADDDCEAAAGAAGAWRCRLRERSGLIAVEDAARYRDALGVPLPPGLPAAFLEEAPEAMVDLVRRFARTHGPFTTHEVAARFELPAESVEAVLQRLVQSGRVVEGGFRPGGVHREWCDDEVLRTIRRRSLARLRKEVEPVEQRTLARLFTRWQGVVQPRRGLDALLDVIENLQGAPLPASMLETEILPARLVGYKPSDLDTLIAAGEVVWVGMEPIGRAGWPDWAVPGGEVAGAVACEQGRGIKTGTEGLGTSELDVTTERRGDCCLSAGRVGLRSFRICMMGWAEGIRGRRWRRFGVWFGRGW